MQQKIAIFLPALYGGGAERVLLNLTQGFAQRGYAVDLVLAKAVGPYLAEVPQAVRLIDLHASRVLFSMPALAHYLRSERPSAVLTALNHANIVALWARRLAGSPSRVVISEHNTFSIWSTQLPYWYSQILTRLLKMFYPWADEIIAVSDGVADDLASVVGLPRHRIRVIYNPIITPELQVKSSLTIDHPWFKNEFPVVLAAGRLKAEKGFDTLIRAFARVRQTQQVKLLILGEGEERSALSRLVSELGLSEDVSLPGFVPNPYPYMVQASVFVLSSRWEGLPTVLVEALYCNLPVVATDCPSGPREILHHGQYGQLVPVGDVESLAQAIQGALEGKTPQPTCESWQPFELSCVADQYMKILSGN